MRLLSFEERSVWSTSRSQHLPCGRSMPMLLVILAVAGWAWTARAQAPSWWTTRAVLDTNATPRDFAPVNQGQVKWLATQAAAEFADKLQALGGAGTQIAALIGSFTTNNNYLPVNAGQLKHTVAPFYDRLFALGLTNCYPPGAGAPYPWSGSSNPANDFALANIGQAKYAFSFDLTPAAVITPDDGVPDWWKQLYGYSVTIGASTVASNGMTLIENYVKGLNPNQPLGALTIPNAWAIYSNTTKVAVFADIRSSSNAVTVKAAEFFLDSTNGVVFGSGTAMSAMDGAFDSTNEMAQALFTPTFAPGTRHVAFIHAQGSNSRWYPFVQVVINPTINDILGRIQANYSAIHDLQFNLNFSVTKNGVVNYGDTVVVTMKGPYKIRKEYANGLCFVQNENTESWYQHSLGGGAMKSGWNGNLDPIANRDCDFFWDVSLWRNRVNSGITGSGSCGSYAIALNPATGSVWLAQNAQADFTHGFVTQLTESVGDMTVTMDYLNPMEVSPGVWLFSSHRNTLRFNTTGNQIIHDSILSDIKVNQGLNDDLFNIPTE